MSRPSIKMAPSGPIDWNVYRTGAPRLSWSMWLSSIERTSSDPTMKRSSCASSFGTLSFVRKSRTSRPSQFSISSNPSCSGLISTLKTVPASDITIEMSDALAMISPRISGPIRGIEPLLQYFVPRDVMGDRLLLLTSLARLTSPSS